MAINHVPSEQLQAAVAAVESKLTPEGEPAPTPEDVIGQEAEAIAAEEKLETDTQSRLDKLFKDGETVDEVEEDDSTPEPESAVDEPKPATDKTDEAEPKPAKEAEVKPPVPMPEAKPAEEPAKPADVKPLPDAYVRAAIHQGWTQKEVEEQYKLNPEITTRTLGKLYESTNRLSKDYAEFGRAKKAAQTSAPTPSPAPAAAPAPAAPVVDPDIAAVRAAYGDDPIVKVVEGLTAKLKAYESKPVAAPEPAAAPVNTEAMSAIRQEVDTFFTDPTIKSYSELYGGNSIKLGEKNWDGLTDAQKKARWDVLGIAQDILVGAVAQGREMTVPEALEKAHLIVSEPVREKVVRNDLMAQVVKRAKGLTLKPSSVVGSDEVDNGPLKPKQVESRAAERLAKLAW